MARIIKILSILICLLFSTNLFAATLFKSGFEDNVEISGFLDGGTNWKKEATGSDQGYDWETDFFSTYGFWNLIINKTAFPTPSNCLTLETTSAQAKTGSESLHMHIHNTCYSTTGCRISYLPSETWPYEETHVKWSLKLASDFDDNVGTQDVILSEIWPIIVSNSYPKIFFAINGGGGTPYFRLVGELAGTGWNPIWIETSGATVPINEWFDLELYINYKAYAEGGGVIWVKLNGTKILEKIPTDAYGNRLCGTEGSTNCTMGDWNIIKWYTYATDIEGWLDDFEVYDTLTDATALVISNENPSGTIPCTSNPRNVTMTWNTTEISNSRIGSTDEGDYDLMPVGSVDNTDSTSHSDTESLACGASYTRYVYAEASGDNEAGPTTITFTIADEQPPAEGTEFNYGGVSGSGGSF